MTEAVPDVGPDAPAIAGWVRAILRCPACTSPLDDAVGPDGAPELWCDGSLSASCRRQYRVDDAIPVLLVDEARHPGAAPSTFTPRGGAVADSPGDS